MPTMNDLVQGNQASATGFEQPRGSFANKLRGAARETRNPEFKKASAGAIQAGQIENTEEVLRKHYFIAKATKKT